MEGVERPSFMIEQIKIPEQETSAKVCLRPLAFLFPCSTIINEDKSHNL